MIIDQCRKYHHVFGSLFPIAEYQPTINYATIGMKDDYGADIAVLNEENAFLFDGTGDGRIGFFLRSDCYFPKVLTVPGAFAIIAYNGYCTKIGYCDLLALITERLKQIHWKDHDITVKNFDAVVAENMFWIKSLHTAIRTGNFELARLLIPKFVLFGFSHYDANDHGAILIDK